MGDNSGEIIMSDAHKSRGILYYLGMGALIGSIAASGCDTKQKREQAEMMENLDDQVTEAISNTNEFTQAAAERFEAHDSAIEQNSQDNSEVRSEVQEVRSEVQAQGAAAEERHTEVQEGLAALAEVVVSANEDAAARDERMAERLDAAEARQTELGEALAAIRAGEIESRSYFNGYSLRRTEEGEGSERIVLFNADNQPLQIITLRRRQNSDLDVLNIIYKDEDADPADGRPDFDRRAGGRYVGEAAGLQATLLDEILLALDNASAANDEEALNTQLERLKDEVGAGPTYPLVDERVLEILRLFRNANTWGSYDSNLSVSVPGSYLGREDITINKVTAGRVYTIHSGDDTLRRIEAVVPSVAEGEPEPETATLRVTDNTLPFGTPGNVYEAQIPLDYLTEMVSAWSTANENGRAAAEMAVREEEDRQRRDQLIEDYDRGLRYTSDSLGDATATGIKVSAGGQRSNLSLEVQTTESSETEGARHIDSDSTFFHLRAGVRPGANPAGASPDNRRRLGFDVFHQGSSVDVTEGAGEPEVSLSTDGRYETTRQSLGGTQHEDTSHLAIGISSDSADGESLFRARYLSSSAGLDWESSESILVRDLAGLLPDVSTQVDIAGSSRLETCGGELTLSWPCRGNAWLFHAGYESGDLAVDDGTSLTEFDLSELRLATGWRHLSNHNWKLTAGGIYTQTDVEGETHEAGDIFADLYLSPSNNLLVAPRLGVTLLGDSAQDSVLWRGGLMLAAGGSRQNSQNDSVLEMYNLENTLMGWEGQFTPEAEEAMQRWGFYNLLTGLDSNVLFSVDAAQHYGPDSSLELGSSARLAAMGQLGGDRRRKFFVDGEYTDTAFETRYGFGGGYLGRRGFARIGYTNSEPAGSQDGSGDDGLTIDAGFRF